VNAKHSLEENVEYVVCVSFVASLGVGLCAFFCNESIPAHSTLRILRGRIGTICT